MALDIQQTRSFREDRCVDYKTPELEDGLFAAGQSTPGEWCEIKGIIAEKHTTYRVLWVGVDPQTGLPWKPEWVKKETVTEDARAEWEDNKRALAEGQKRKKRSGSGASKSPAERPCNINWPKGQRHKQQKEPAYYTATQNSEYYPSQSFANYKYSSLPLRSIPHLLPAERPPQAPALLALSPNSPSHVSRFLHVLIDTSAEFNPKAYARVSDTVLVPSTQHNGFASDTCEKAPARLLDAPDDRVEYTRLSTVIPDSQAFDDTGVSAFVDISVDHLEPETIKKEHEYIPATYSSPEKGSLEYEESSQVEETVRFPVQSIEGLETPPPSYEESTFQSSNHTLEVQFEPTVQVVEAAVQTDLPFEEELELVKNGNESAPQSNKQGQGSQESSIFDLDLPQDPGLSYRTEPSPETSDAGEPLQGGDPYSKNGISRDFESPRPSENLSTETGIADPSEQEDASCGGGPREATAGEAPLDPALQKEALKRRPEAQELIEYRRDRRQGSRLGDWFRNSASPGRPTTGFPFPFKSFSAYTKSDYLRSPSISPSMSETFPTPSTPMTLREKLAARRKALDEEIARRRAAISLQAATQPSSAPGLLSTNSPSAQLNQQPPAVGLLPSTSEIPSQSDQDAQLPTHQPPASRSHNIDSKTSAVTPQPPVQTEESTQLAWIAPWPNRAFQLPMMGVGEYAIGLPLSTKTLQAGGLSQKSVYLNAIAGKHADVEAYLTNTEGASTELAESAFELLRSVGQIAAHPNTICPVTVSSGSDEKEAEFHTVMSTKFQFLRDLFSLITDEMVKIAVVAEGPALIDMLEVFFRGIKVQYSRLDKLSTLPPVSEDDLEGMAKVLLVPSDGGGAVGTECHLIIAMDSTFSANIDEVQQMRKDMYDPAKKAPILRLVAINTIEHVLLCVATAPAKNLRACVEAVTNLRYDVGVLDPTYAAATRSAAEKIREWIRGGCAGRLEVPLLPALPMFGAAQYPHVDVTEKRKREGSSLPSEATNADPKKRKVLGQPTSFEPQTPLEVDNTHITSTMSSQLPHGPEAVSPQREDMDIDSATPTEPQFLMGDPARDALSRDQLLSPAHQQEDRLRSYMVSEDRHARLNETLRQDVAKLKAEIRSLENTIDKMDAEKERLIADKRKMENKHVDLKAQLAKALESLNSDDLTTTHGKLLSENLELKKKVEHLQRKVESTERDAQFAREQYQTASNSIYEVRQENEELQSTCETLRRKADDNIATLRRMNYDFGVSRQDDEMEKLKARLKQSEDRVGKLELEKANTSRKGMLGTRSMSVPKRGSPAQSRASSPSVVSIAHPLRNRQSSH